MVVQLARLRDGRRVVWEVAAVEGSRRGEPVVEPLFAYRARDDGGRFVATGTLPDLAQVLRDRGQGVPDDLFEPGEDAA